MLVDTATLATALGVSPAKVRKLVHLAVLHPAARKRLPGRNGRGRPAMWFDLDTSMALLDQHQRGCDSP